MCTQPFFILFIVFLWSGTASFAHARDYTFSWSANPVPVTGYKLYYKKDGSAGPPFNGTGAQQGPSPINVGKKTSYTIRGLADNTTYHFALTAYDGKGESAYSQVVTVAPQKTAPIPVILNIKIQ